MLGKLIKHDFRSTSKVLIPLNGILIIITIIGSLILSTKMLQRDELLPLSLILLVTYITMMFAIGMVTVIYIIVSFYRNMFTAQGYLTFTLPASPWSLLHSKVIVGYAWFLLNSILTYCSAYVLTGSAVGFGRLPGLLNEIFTTNLVDNAKAIQVYGPEFSFTLSDMLGSTPFQLLLMTAALTVFSSFSSLIIGYASIVIGQLYAKHKVIGSVLAYVGINFITQIITTMAMFAISFRHIFQMVSIDDSMGLDGFTDMMQSIYRPMFPTIIVIQMIFGIACYIAAGIIMNRKVNLD